MIVPPLNSGATAPIVKPIMAPLPARRRASSLGADRRARRRVDRRRGWVFRRAWQASLAERGEQAQPAATRPGQAFGSADRRHRRGNVESRVTIDGVCELNGYQNKLIFLVPRAGPKVKKGQVVCKFDDSEIQKNPRLKQDIRVKTAIARIEAGKQDMEIQRNACENALDTATVQLSLAALDLESISREISPPRRRSRKGTSSSRRRTSRNRTTSWSSSAL